MGRRPEPRPEPDPEVMRVAGELLAHFETPKGAEELQRVREALAAMQRADEQEAAPRPMSLKSSNPTDRSRTVNR